MGRHRAAGAVRDVRPPRRLRPALRPDRVGHQPGANVGRSVYHSGTVGATLTGTQRRRERGRGQPVGHGVRRGGAGLGRDAGQPAVGHRGRRSPSAVVERLVADLPTEPVVVNLNVPNVALDEIKGWRRTVVGTLPPRAMAAAVLEPKEGHDGTFHVRMGWGDPVALPSETDGGAVELDEVSITFLGRLMEDDVQPRAAGRGGRPRRTARPVAATRRRCRGASCAPAGRRAAPSAAPGRSSAACRPGRSRRRSRSGDAMLTRLAVLVGAGDHASRSVALRSAGSSMAASSLRKPSFTAPSRPMPPNSPVGQATAKTGALKLPPAIAWRAEPVAPCAARR